MSDSISLIVQGVDQVVLLGATGSVFLDAIVYRLDRVHFDEKNSDLVRIVSAMVR